MNWTYWWQSSYLTFLSEWVEQKFYRIHFYHCYYIFIFSRKTIVSWTFCRLSHYDWICCLKLSNGFIKRSVKVEAEILMMFCIYTSICRWIHHRTLHRKLNSSSIIFVNLMTSRIYLIVPSCMLLTNSFTDLFFYPILPGKIRQFKTVLFNFPLLSQTLAVVFYIYCCI